MIHVGDRVVVMDRNSPEYMQSRCVIAVRGDRITISNCGDDVECNISDVLPYDTFLAIIRHGAACRAALGLAVGHAEKIMGDVMGAVIRYARADIDVVGVDPDAACRVLEAFVDMLPLLSTVGSILNACAGDCPDRGEPLVVSRARSELYALMLRVRNCGNDCRAGEYVRGGCE